MRRGDLDVTTMIAYLTVLRGSIRPADLLLVPSWAGPRRADLALNWVLARAGLPMNEDLEPRRRTISTGSNQVLVTGRWSVGRRAVNP